MPDELPPTPPAIEQRSEVREDPIAAYQREVAELMGAPKPEGYVDPHLADAQSHAPDEVESRDRQDDVDPQTRFSDGPSEAELRHGEDDPLPAEDTAPDRGLPKEEESPEPAATPAAAEQPAPAAATPAADPVEALALSLRAANPNLTLKAALALAENALIAPPAATSPTPEATPEPEVPTVADLEEERRRVDKEWRQGIRDLADDAQLDKLETRLTEIDALLPQARAAESQRGQKQTTDYETHAARALELYPDAGTPGTDLFARMELIHADLEKSNDPLILDPSKSLVIAQMAAKELRIAPRSPGTAAPAQPQAKPAATPAARPRSGGSAPMTAPLAGASTRPAAPAPNPTEKAIDEIRTPEQYEAVMHSLRRR